MTAERAVTLVELLVVLVLLGLAAGVAGLTMHTANQPAAIDPVVAAIETARDSAIRTGRSVSIVLRVGGNERYATAAPDGRVLADTGLDIDPLTGLRNVRR